MTIYNFWSIHKVSLEVKLTFLFDLLSDFIALYLQNVPIWVFHEEF